MASKVLAGLAFAAALYPFAARAHAQSYSGTWTMQLSAGAHVTLQYRLSQGQSEDSWTESFDASPAEIQPSVLAQLRTGGRRNFTIAEDAGQFQAQGGFSADQGSGTWVFDPNPGFAEQLARRGIGRPNDKEQFELAISRFRLASLDALAASGFERPSINDLIRMIEHDVTASYVASMKNVNIRPKSVSSLIRLRDHGVDPLYAAQMLRFDPGLSGDDLVELRDHGVSSAYVTTLSSLGYHPGPGDLIRLVDHGVSALFIERMRSHGYTHLSVDDLIRLRDHGF